MASHSSIRATLLVWLLLPLAGVAALDTYLTIESAHRAATNVQDRLLLGSARSIAERLRVSDSHIVVTIPPSALELLDTGLQDRVFYRVTGPDGRLLAGYEELDDGARASGPEEWTARNGDVRGSAVRVVSFSQPLYEAPRSGPALIQVAQTIAGQTQLAREIWLGAMRQQVLILVLVGALVWIGLRKGLQPLTALRDRMALRQPGAVEAITDVPVPAELAPLVDALNEYVGRINEQMQLHSRFLADASHQMRTPLTVLNTQIAFAIRKSDPAITEEVLRAMRRSVQSTIRLVNQLLTVTQVEADSSPDSRGVRVDLCQAVTTALEDLASLADAKQIDLGYESDTECVTIVGIPHMVQTLAVNLIDNAIRYTQPGGTVTVRVEGRSGSGVALHVIDNGPGIPLAEHERVFERFYRLLGRPSDGCGLGLAIVREVALAHDATWRLGTPADGPGLSVTIVFPRLTSGCGAR